ncbi:MAG TPA: ATP-binding cassette domain-containing protein [Burkholderiaceae bacterium]|nr:ATP-binding cassette domain-containing protein [Burkholderiaceae bacterium]
MDARTVNRNDAAPAADAPLLAEPVVVNVSGLTRRFGALVAVDHASLHVQRREIFGLIGRNGAGKSTLIKMLTTLLPPSGGTAQVAGYDIVAQPADVRRAIGYVPQLLSADGELTGYENLLLSARLYLLPRAEREQRIGEALAMMGLEDVRDRLVGTYSGGMIRRLEIAQSALHRPRVIFMDEPTIGLDPTGRHAVWAQVQALRQQFGTSIIITTHQMDEADALCDRIGVIHAGHVVAVGTPQELKLRVGAGATLDDVFTALTVTNIDTRGDYRHVREERRGVSEHG